MITPALINEEKLLTGEEFYEQAAVGPYELVKGRIVEMTLPKPDHGWYELNLAAAIKSFVDAHNLGRVMTGEVGIYTGRNPDTVRGADVVFISHERYSKATPRSYLDVAPELIGEIISPNDRWRDIQQKLHEYFSIGINVVILLEPQDEVVLVYRSLTDVQDYRLGDILPLEDVLPGFRLDVTKLFHIG